MPCISQHTERKWLAFLFVAALMLYSVGMVRIGFEGKDERRYAQAAKEIGPGADFFVMRYLGDYYPDKPPLFFWAQAASFKAFGGVSPGAARLPLLLSALAALAFSYLTIRQMDGPRLALVAMVALALSFRFFWSGRWARLDMPMIAFVFGSFWVSARMLFPLSNQPPVHKSWPLLAWVFAGLAVLAKGPGVIVWLGAILTFAVAQRDRSVIRIHRPLIGLAILLGLVLAWFAPAAILGGRDYWGPMLGTHVVERFAGEVRHGRPIWYFFAKVFSDTIPVGLLLPAALWNAWRQRKAVDGGRLAFYLCWIGFTLIFFTIPAGKRGQYILPLYPAVAALVARFVVAGADRPESRVGVALRWHWRVLGVVAAVGGLGFLFMSPDLYFLLPDKLTEDFPSAPSLSARLFLFIGLTGGGVCAFLLQRRKRLLAAGGAMAAAFFVFYVSLFAFFFPVVRDDTVPRAVAETIEEADGSDARVALFELEDEFTLYGPFLPRIIQYKKKLPSQIREFMDGEGTRWALVHAGRFAEWKDQMGEPDWEEVGRWIFHENVDEQYEIILFRTRTTDESESQTPGV